MRVRFLLPLAFLAFASCEDEGRCLMPREETTVSFNRQVIDGITVVVMVPSKQTVCDKWAEPEKG